MEKDFDRWNKKKKILNSDAEPLYFREGEIWWVHLGVNVGYEMDGKQDNFARPVIILRKYNKYSFLALPLNECPPEPLENSRRHRCWEKCIRRALTAPQHRQPPSLSKVGMACAQSVGDHTRANNSSKLRTEIN
jgi:hypothetical protein